MRNFKGKVAVVTGGAGGLGRAMSLRLAVAGAAVALWDIDPIRLKEVEEEIVNAGGKAKGYVVDLTDPGAVRRAAVEVRDHLGEVDILDNNAGVVFPGDFVSMSEDRLKKTMDVNVNSFMWCTKAFLPRMLERGSGHLVMTASASGLLGVPGGAVYAASKHAVIGLAESLRLEIKKAGAHDVGMTIVCPSFISTGMFEGVKAPLLTPWLTADRVADKTMAAIRSGKLYVAEPFMVKLVPLLKTLPLCVFDFLGRVTGMHRSMENLHGRRS